MDINHINYNYNHHHHHHHQHNNVHHQPMLLSNHHHHYPLIDDDENYNQMSTSKSSSNFNYQQQTTAIRNLRLQMHEIHLQYININNNDNDNDNNEMKNKLRKQLDNLINKYLIIIKPDDKFTFKQQFNNCLQSTICKQMNFNPEKVIQAFELLERYTINLLNYPWRHEYHKIYVFGRNFRLIKYSLLEFNELLNLIGYYYDPVLDIYQLKEIPIDPDRMIAISFDCLISIVEIEIMWQIMKKSSLLNQQIQWKDLYLIRCQYICNVNNAIEILHSTNNRLIDLSSSSDIVDLPDYSMKKFDKIDIIKSSPINENNVNQEIIIPPPLNYLESDLDKIDFIDSTTSSSIQINEQKQNEIKSDTIIVGKKLIKTKLTPTTNDDQQSSSSINNNNKNWSCTSCTYVNDNTQEICCMCHRSRIKGNESLPLITGGRQCNKCTLVNDKLEKYCSACGTSLADSPTYI